MSLEYSWIDSLLKKKKKKKNSPGFFHVMFQFDNFKKYIVGYL